MISHSAVVGDPIAQSLSPLIHNAAYRYLGLQREYNAYLVSAGSLDNFLDTRPEIDLVSVTMPLKFEAFTLSTPIGVAKTTGVVNTLLRKGDELLGFNTDVFGLTKAIEHQDLRKVLILGTGATARSAIEAVRIAGGDSEINVAGRSLEKLGALDKTVNTFQLDSIPGGFTFVINTIPNFQVDSKSFINTAYSKDEDLELGQVSGKQMLLWQAIGQLRVLINGSPDKPLADEDTLFEVMRSSIA